MKSLGRRGRRNGSRSVLKVDSRNSTSERWRNPFIVPRLSDQEVPWGSGERGEVTDVEYARLEAELFDDFPLPLHGLHGARHWRRVDCYGRLLASQSGADLEVVRRFALFHDSQRFCEGHDEDHGVRAANRARQFCADELSAGQMQLLWLACAGHSGCMCSDDPTIGTCWDADRLDLDRLRITPLSAMMSTPMGRQLADMEPAERLQQASLPPWKAPSKTPGLFGDSLS